MSHSPKPDVRQMPVYWFAIMDRSRAHGHNAEAEQARQELERLGVSVEYRDRPVIAGRILGATHGA